MNIELVIEGCRISAEIVDHHEAVSQHTERQLRSLDVEFEIADEDCSEVVKGLSGRSIVQDSDGTSFKVVNRSYSYSPGFPTTFNFELKEHEELLASRVLLDNYVALTPYHYVEEDRDGIVIEFAARASGEAMDDLESLVCSEPFRYFPVLREGVHDKPLEMRFGRCLWETAEDGSKNHLLILVSRTHDENHKDEGILQINQPQVNRLEEEVVALQGLVNHLVEHMVAKDIMSEMEASTIRRVAQEPSRAQRRQFDRTNTLEDFFMQAS